MVGYVERRCSGLFQKKPESAAFCSYCSFPWPCGPELIVTATLLFPYPSQGSLMLFPSRLWGLNCFQGRRSRSGCEIVRQASTFDHPSLFPGTQRKMDRETASVRLPFDLHTHVHTLAHTNTEYFFFLRSGRTQRRWARSPRVWTEQPHGTEAPEVRMLPAEGRSRNGVALSLQQRGVWEEVRILDPSHRHNPFFLLPTLFQGKSDKINWVWLHV